jgi:hypothetical protein
MNRMITLVVVAIVAVGMLAYGTHNPSHASDVKVVKLTAKKFDFSPSEITVKKGSPVAL